MRESLAKALEGDVNIAAHTLLPPIKAKPAPAQSDNETSNASRTKYIGRRPPMPRSDPAAQRVFAAARRVLAKPKLAMHLIDMAFPTDAQSPRALRLLKSIVDIAIYLPDDPNHGAILERFRDTEFAADVAQLLTHRDHELDALLSDAEVEDELRSLRAQIESGSLFPAQRIIEVPSHVGAAGILALGARRTALPEPPGASALQSILPSSTVSAPLPPRGGGVGERGQTLIANARELRTNQTPWESELWYELRAKRFAEIKFRRQQPIGNYIVDFVTFEKKLIIELDGSQHAEQTAYDSSRDQFLRGEGFNVVRIWNSEWSSNRKGVLDRIYFELFDDNHPLPSLRDTLPPQGGGAHTDTLDDGFDDIPFDAESLGEVKFAPPENDDHPPF
ncbi:MAG: DUF559 domain-containing protein [Casimicrobium sp.]